MRNDQPVYIISNKATNEIKFVDESFVNLQRTLDVEKELPAKDTLAKLRAGLEVEFAKHGHTYRIVRWDLKTGQLDEAKTQSKETKKTA